MKERLDNLRKRLVEVEKEVENPNLIKDVAKYKETMREHSYLSKLMEEYDNYLSIEKQIEDSKLLIQEESDAELKEMAREELHSLEAAFEKSEADLKMLLIPPDPLEEKNIIMEIRGGTGGDEAALFAADLLECIPTTPK